MWIIKYGDGRKLAGKTYRFVCPACRCNRYVDPEKLGVCYEP